MKKFENVLIYVGGHHGNGVSGLIDDYEKVFIFEANPNFCRILFQRFNSHPHVKIINAAVCDRHNESMYFYISSNNGDSSSLLEPNKESNLYHLIKTQEKIVVPTVNLINFLEENDIKSVKTYISDLQGCDFLVLTTLKLLIDNKSIETIQCEVEKDGRPNIYTNKSKTFQNKLSNFEVFLDDNYKKCSSGWGVLTENKFEDVPEDWSEFDVKWKVK